MSTTNKTSRFINVEGESFPYFIVNFKDKLESKSNFRIKKSDWAVMKRFESMVSAEVSRALPAQWEIGSREDKLIERPKVACALIAAGRVDNGNISKSILDSLEGLVYINDASVISSTSLSASRKESGFSLGFLLLPRDIELSRVTILQNLLTQEVLTSFREGSLESAHRV